MEKRNRRGLQIRFNQESEQDIIEFFSQLKKPEVHITAISAFRMYMKSVGFFEKKKFENLETLSLLYQLQNGKSSNFKTATDSEKDGLFDEENRLKN